MDKCCDSPQIRTVSFYGNGQYTDGCDHCGKQIDTYYPELAQAVFRNPTASIDFDQLPDAHVLEYMVRTIAYYATGDTSYAGDFTNDVFEIHPYYWGDCTCGYDNWGSEANGQTEHAPNCPSIQPNFYHKSSGLVIYWYKYIGRGMSVNKYTCPQCFGNIFAQCMNSIGQS